ncbi:MAG: phosphotransferase system lactose/cellobiose-specific subunit [Clostridia bacterium]|jgi:PTS system ascorbate-specific IIB component|nr:phosphotransferase system lactose/cellobiose-specific subunit [Clostridia bacterium]
MKILAVCGTGLGSSFMVEMNIQTILKELGAKDVEVEHSDLGAATPGAADIFIAGRDIAMAMKHLDNVVELNNLLDKKELKEKISTVLKARNII